MFQTLLGIRLVLGSPSFEGVLSRGRSRELGSGKWKDVKR